MLKYIIVLILTMALTSCKDGDQGTTFQKCDISTCADTPEGEYCFFGYKWGDGNPMSSSGNEAAGPETSGGTITFGFYGEGEIIHTHSQTDITTLPFGLLACEVESQIVLALNAWSSVADIDFQEINEVESADIKFALAHIEQGGVGYPPYTDDLCSLISGLVVLNTGRPTCDAVYNLILHETGHVLGLGHVDSNNIMNPNYDQNSIVLGNGDVQGIQAIYGKK